jgi:lipopolysaccharide assembly protein A
MRWFHIAVIAVLAIVTLILVVQNFHGVTFSFLNLSLTMPLALLIVIVYAMGAATGGSLWGLIRWAAAGARQPES